MVNPKQRLIEHPIKPNYREGLSVLECPIATHGARKGLADTTPCTADSGYLTCRLVNVSQDVIVHEGDCGTRKGLTKRIFSWIDAGDKLIRELSEILGTTVFDTTLARDTIDVEGNLIVEAGADLGNIEIQAVIDAGIEEITVRSMLTCDSNVSTCVACYSRSLATGKCVDIGEVVGITVAQSIGEPGAQLIMHTSHTGGAVSAADIIQGLPRVQESSEVRTPKGEAAAVEAVDILKTEDDADGKRLAITCDDGEEDVIVPVSRRQRLLVNDGDHVEPGQALTEGPVDPKKVLRLRSVAATQRHLAEEIQEVYRPQGVGIHSKRTEVIVRQMLRRVTVLDSGNTRLLQGDLVDVTHYRAENRRAMAEGGKTATGRTESMGITKASLTTDPWLSVTSFQETMYALIEAVMSGKSDPLLGLKENVTLGKLIPAGTGLARYSDIEVEPIEEVKVEIFSRADLRDDVFGGPVALDDFHSGEDLCAGFSDDFRTGFSSSKDVEF